MTVQPEHRPMPQSSAILQIVQSVGPLAILVGAFVWVGQLDGEVGSLAASLAETKARMTVAEAGLAQQRVDLSTLLVQMQGLREDVAELKEILIEKERVNGGR